MKQKSRLILPVLLSLFAFVVLTSFVSAQAPVLVSPASSSTISGATAVLNATNGTILEVRNCSFFAKSVSTLNSTYVFLGNISNTTASQKTFNTTFNSAILIDSTDYSFIAQCQNATEQDNSTANTGVTIDNGVPSAATSVRPSAGALNFNNVTFSAVINPLNTTKCNLIFSGTNPGSLSYAMTVNLANSSCQYTLNLPTNSYSFLVQTSDGTNTTNTGTSLISIFPPSNVGTPTAYQQQQIAAASSPSPLAAGVTIGNTSIPVWFLLFLGALVILVLILIFRKKK